MVLPQNIYHVFPINDLKPHQTVSFYREDFLPYCICQCKPEHKEQENGAMIIVHNSFDGREGVEWAKELLNDK